MITDKIDRTTAIEQEYSGTVLPAPKSVKISLDDNCQFRCNFCTSRLQPNKPKMSWHTFTQLIDELVANGTEEIGLFYIGEPMLAALLPGAIAYCKKAGIKYVFITTNGHLATPDKVRELMAMGLDSLKFSFNYADGDQLHDVAGVSGSVFDKIVANIKAAKRIRDEGGYSCGIYASSIMFDGEQGEKMRKAVEVVLPYLDEHYWLPCYSFGGQTDKGKVAGNPGRLDNLRDPLPCWAVFKEGHVSADGSVSLCCFDSHSRWTAGNLNTMSFMDAWNSEFSQKLRSAHLARNVIGTPCEFCSVAS